MRGFTANNKTCLRSGDTTMPVAFIKHVSPTSLLTTVALNDAVTSTYLALEAYSVTLEPKQLQILPGGISKPTQVLISSAT